MMAKTLFLVAFLALTIFNAVGKFAGWDHPNPAPITYGGPR